MSLLPTPDPLLLAYILTFAIAALACFASILRARRIDDRDTRLGIVALLATSGGWALCHVGFLLAPTIAFKEAFYVLGLVVGFATVGPWLYFCSAYTGRTLHRNRRVQQLAVATFLLLVAVKVTNPIHGRYFASEIVDVPFRHLAIHNGVLHWSAMGLSYALAAVGYFMVLELFVRVGADTRPVAVLVGVTGLPVVLDVIGYASPALVDITYEPIGVAVFAVGICFVYFERFQSVGLAGESDEPVILVNEDDTVRDYNRTAAALFPELTGDNVIGENLQTILPNEQYLLREEESVVELERAGETRYYRVTARPFGTGASGQGRMLTLTDVTRRERYRRELERQNERLETFASMLSHDLRNPLNVATGRLELLAEEVAGEGSDGEGVYGEHVDAIENAHERMEEIIEDVLTLARQGQPIDDPESVTLQAVAAEAWDLVDTADATVDYDGDLAFVADEPRLQQLFENLFRNAIDHVGTDVAVTVGTLADEEGFYVEDDGPGIPAEERDEVFESGYTTAADGTGFGLSIVSEIVHAHGWSIAVVEGRSGGARFEITGVEPAD